MDTLHVRIENSPDVLTDDTPPTISEQTILTEIQDISNKISCKKTFNLNSLGNYAQILKTLEENRNKFVEGQSIDLKPLQSFAVSAEQLTGYMQSLIDRFNGLANINNATIMKDIHVNIDKINNFVSTSEHLFKMMDNPEKFEWFTKYNDTVMSIKNSMNAYEKIAKQITYQLSDPVNYVNPQIKNLTDLFNNNYINNPLPQNFLIQNNQNTPSIQSLPPLDSSIKTESTQSSQEQPISQQKNQEQPVSQQKNQEQIQTNTIQSSSQMNTIIITVLVMLVLGLLGFIIYTRFKS